ncbi:hypothetical protein OIU76_028104 [Salix suchowensis]|nr:hypothetical protein OIU76_028104 [Salix suchowensis]
MEMKKMKNELSCSAHFLSFMASKLNVKRDASMAFSFNCKCLSFQFSFFFLCPSSAGICLVGT